MNEKRVETRIQGGALVVQMQDPASRNALSRAMLAGLTEAIEAVGVDIPGIVITGEGGCFSAGADFRELKGTRQDLEYDQAVARLIASILASDRIIVAAVEGACMGAAADIALACDYRIAGEGSFMQVPAVRLGLLYNPEAIERLSRLYRADTVRRLLLAGERFDAHEACRAGLFSCVVPRGESLARVLQALEPLDGQQADAIRSTKRLLSELESGRVDMNHWQRRRLELLDSEQRKHAIQKAHERFVHKKRAATDE
jgi:enoyl-CoA hydratase/carnithine racemase